MKKNRTVLSGGFRDHIFAPIRHSFRFSKNFLTKQVKFNIICSRNKTIRILNDFKEK